MGCNCSGRKASKFEVSGLPSGETKTVNSRTEALAAISAAGGVGTMRPVPAP